MKYYLLTFFFLNYAWANIQFRCVEYQKNRKVKTCVLPLYSETNKNEADQKSKKIWLERGQSYHLVNHPNCQLNNRQLDFVVKNNSPIKNEYPLPTDTDFPDLENATIFEASIIKYQNEITDENVKRENLSYDVKVKVEISNPPLIDLPQKDLSFIVAGSGLRCTWKLLK